jgi:Tfp pilus assembly protein PilV
MRAQLGNRREDGFTMVEVMVSIMLTAIAVLGIVALYMVETRSSNFSRHNTEAAILAEDKMEVLRTQISPTSGLETSLDEPGGVVGMFSRRWGVTVNTAWIDYNVTVSWSEDGVARNLTLSSRRGL